MITLPCPKCGKAPKVKIKRKGIHTICIYKHKCCKFEAQGVNLAESAAVESANELWNEFIMDMHREKESKK